jgi:4-alpha-glucanotransferase
MMPSPLRRAGLLLHPTSLPGPFGIGDLGPAAEAFLDWAAAAGQRLWQVLPLGPPGLGGSPYTARSAFAGNPLLISPERLVAAGLLPAASVGASPSPAGSRVDFAAVAPWKDSLLREAWGRFRREGSHEHRERLRAFAASPAHAAWLADWELFAALAARFPDRAWSDWPAPLARREPGALEQVRRELLDEVGYHRFAQYLFFEQWAAVRAAAARRGIAVFGDVPIYVAADSADVWAHPELFDLDGEGRPRHVAGVPPDYFSPTGQRWGNPLYLWERMAADGFAWWVSRLRANLELADLVRIDHFRGLAAYWQIPASEPTALEGRWQRGPGLALFAALRRGLGSLPIVAEDLGTITPDVEALREGASLPGMKVLQFAFAEPDSSHLPHHHVPRCVVYTGTHDNDTTVGWFAALGAEERGRVLDYVGGEGTEPHWDLIRAAYTSVADQAVVPLQDVFGLGSRDRMNVPGEPDGNWAWRVLPGQLGPDHAARLRYLAQLTGRLRPVTAGAAGR